MEVTKQTGKPPAEIGVVSVAFGIGGVIALVTAHCYSKLSVAYPDRGGTVDYLDRAFGATAFTETLNVLLLLSYIVMLVHTCNRNSRRGVAHE